MLLFQTFREIIFYFQHFIQVCFYFLEKKNWGGPSPCYGTDMWALKYFQWLMKKKKLGVPCNMTQTHYIKQPIWHVLLLCSNIIYITMLVSTLSAVITVFTSPKRENQEQLTFLYLRNNLRASLRMYWLSVSASPMVSSCQCRAIRNMRRYNDKTSFL